MTRIRLTAAIGAAFVLVAVALLTWSVDDPAARAVVSPRVGYRATVLGWSSWYGSYDLGAAGTGWCIDHGLAAPDPAFRYVAVTAGDVDADRRAAIAWIVSSHGGTSDPVDAAAVMLAIHDLRGATYPFGVMDVDRLTTRDLAGFGGHEADVIVRARATKAAGLAHQGPRAPFHLALHLTVTGVGTGRATAIVTDAVGHAVDGALVRVTATGATVDSSDWAVSAADGSITRSYRSADVASPAHFDAEASIPDPALSVVASSTVRAQRVARPAWLAIRGAADLAPAPTTTTSTPPTTVAPTTTIVPTTTTTAAAPTTTTTTAPSTTTTGPRPTTTTVPTSTTIPASTTTTTRPTTSTTGGSVTPTTGATTTTELAPLVPLAPVPAGPPTGPASLPLTGGRTAAWALLGLGLVAIGGALVAVGRRRRGLTLTGPTGTLDLRATRRATRRSS